MKNLPLKYQFFPSKVPSKKLMVVLHGRGDSSNGFTWLPDAMKIDTMNYLLLDAPSEYFGGCSWYDLAPHQYQGIVDSSKHLTEIFDILFEEDFNAHESFLFGFSQGSLLTFEFGARYSKLLAGYIAISGYIYDAKTLSNELNPLLKKHSQEKNNWLCTHGTEDDVLAFQTSKMQVELLQDAGLNIDFKSYHKAHTIAQDELQMIQRWVQDRC